MVKGIRIPLLEGSGRLCSPAVGFSQKAVTAQLSALFLALRLMLVPQGHGAKICWCKMSGSMAKLWQHTIIMLPVMRVPFQACVLACSLPQTARSQPGSIDRRQARGCQDKPGTPAGVHRGWFQSFINKFGMWLPQLQQLLCHM